MLIEGLRETCSQVAWASAGFHPAAQLSQGWNDNRAGCPNQPATFSAKPRNVTALSETTWKASPEALVGWAKRPLERLGHIVGVDVVDGLEPEVGQRDLLALGQLFEHVDVEVAGRVDRRPAGADDVPRVQHGARQRPAASFAREAVFDGRLLRPVLAEGPAHGVLCDRHRRAGPVHPDRAAVQQVAARVGARASTT